MSKSWDVRTAVDFAIKEGIKKFDGAKLELEDDRDKALKLLLDFNLESFIREYEPLVASSGAVKVEFLADF
jgi:hypothetical protein